MVNKHISYFDLPSYSRAWFDKFFEIISIASRTSVPRMIWIILTTMATKRIAFNQPIFEIMTTWSLCNLPCIMVGINLYSQNNQC